MWQLRELHVELASMFSPQYRALAAALLLFTAAILISSYDIVREYELITGKFVPNLWVAAQAEIEYFRFVNQLERHTFDDAEEFRSSRPGSTSWAAASPSCSKAASWTTSAPSRAHPRRSSA